MNASSNECCPKCGSPYMSLKPGESPANRYCYTCASVAGSANPANAAEPIGDLELQPADEPAPRPSGRIPQVAPSLGARSADVGRAGRASGTTTAKRSGGSAFRGAAAIGLVAQPHSSLHAGYSADRAFGRSAGWGRSRDFYLDHDARRASMNLWGVTILVRPYFFKRSR